MAEGGGILRSGMQGKHKLSHNDVDRTTQFETGILTEAQHRKVVASRQPQEYGTIVLQIEEKEAQRLRAPNCCSRRLCHPGLSTVEKLRKFAQKVNIQEALPPLKTHRAHQANASVVLNTISWGQTLATRVEECGVVVTALHITTSSISKKRSSESFSTI
ncbi:hypothetical protein F441_18967 [Phytophthora nicotianae CJ01A1]|nr:hypothetical protein F441_18967 [Phytophthora nicotianae CJ01A1]